MGPPAGGRYSLGRVTQHPSKVRRTPRFAAFLATGGGVGLLVGVLVGFLGPTSTKYDSSAALGFLGLICALLGVLVGGVIAVLLDKRS